jgi:hypothetical protein
LIERVRRVALVAVLLVIAAACTRASTGSTISPATVYSAGVQLSDVAPIVGDTGNWWPGPPTFSVRPLDTSTRPEQERYNITIRFTHNGSAESLEVIYRVWDTTANAKAVMDSLQTALGTSLTGAAVGDQVLYYNQLQRFGASPYVTETLVRLGQVDVTIIWSRAVSFNSTTQSAKLASKVVSRLRGTLTSKSNPSPQPTPDAVLLPPDGPDLTLLGSTTLPVEATAALLNAASPAATTKLFTDLGVHDFVYGDYALDNDTHMEVRSSAFTFSDPGGPQTWIDALIGASSLDANGSYFGYDDSSGQYIAAFTGGLHGAILICKSAGDFESASRACEVPMGRVAGAWRQALQP